jgi:hypothetical protein
MRRWTLLAVLTGLAVLVAAWGVVLWPEASSPPSDSIVPATPLLAGVEESSPAAEASGDPIGPEDYDIGRANVTFLLGAVHERGDRPVPQLASGEGPDLARVLRRVLLDVLTNPDLKQRGTSTARPGTTRWSCSQTRRFRGPLGGVRMSPGTSSDSEV